MRYFVSQCHRHHKFVVSHCHHIQVRDARLFLVATWYLLLEVMSARRVTVDTRLEEPANPTYIDFPRGDGQPITWPTNTTRIVDSEGQVNFFDPLPLSHNQSIRWRALVASAIANDLQMAGAFLFCKLADTHMKLSFVSLQRGHRIF